MPLPPLPPSEPPAAHAAWWIWLLAQAAVVALYAGRIKLAGGYPEPVEATADLGVACAQLLLATLLGPSLLATPGRVGRTLAAGLVFVVIAAALADRSITDTARLAGVTGLWLIAIGRLTRTPVGRQVAAFLTIAGPILFYANLEYADPPHTLGDAPTLLTPMLGVCTTRLHSALFRPAIVPLVVILISVVTHFRRKSMIRGDRDIRDTAITP